MNRLLIFPIVTVVFIGAIALSLQTSFSNISLGVTSPTEDIGPARFTQSELILTSMRSTSEYTAPVGRFETFEFIHDDTARLWHGLPATGSDLRPTVILLHGSNRNGAAMLDMWQAVGRDRNINLIAPDAKDSRNWRRDHDGEDFIRALVQDASIHMAVDPGQIYLFGHSSGASAAIELANQSDLNLRAVAVHGGGIRARTMQDALRATPVRIYLGDNDHTFDAEQAQEEATALAARGNPTDLVLIPDHTHWYYDLGPRLSYEVTKWFESIPDPIQVADSEG